MVYRIDSSTNTLTMPTPSTAGTEGFFQDGNPALSIPYTVLTPDWANMVQEEIRNVVVAAGITPSKLSNNQLLLALQTIFAEKLTANTTLYVSTSGNDTTGVGTQALPFATISRAWAWMVANLNLNGYTLTISVANGTYTGVVNLDGMPQGGGSVIVQGNISSPSSVILNVSTGSFNTVNVGSATVTINGFQLESTTAVNTSYANCLVASLSNVTITNIIFASYNGYAFVASQGSQIGVSSGISVANNVAGLGFGVAELNGLVYSLASAAVSFGTGISWNSGAGSTMQATQCGGLSISGLTFSGGTPTGYRYACTVNGYIDTNSAGASFIPGTIAGTTSNGGQYV